MAFFDYIILDGYRYKTLAKQWRPITQRPATARLTLLGNLEGTFGSGALVRWDGLISVSHGESAPGAADGSLSGNIYTLRQTLAKQQEVAFTDHNGNSYGEAVIVGPFDEQTLVSVWSSSQNKYFVKAQIVVKA